MEPKVPQRKLGNETVSAIGLGCMGMSFSYTSFGGYDDDESLRVLTAAADAGVTFWDTSDIYGAGKNEELLGRWFAENPGRRSEIFLATKFGHQRGEDGRYTIRGDREWVFASAEASLKRLGVDTIDLWYQHRVDPKKPIEETVGAMAELVKQGKVRYLGLSECSATTLRRACKVHPIAAAQMEFSPFALEIESEQTKFLETARELGVKIVAYSPLGRGFLTGAIKSRADLDPSDGRWLHPRFSEENFMKNFELVSKMTELAKKKGCTPGQLSLAWVMAQGCVCFAVSAFSYAKPQTLMRDSEDFIPIPGTKRLKYLEENIKAVDVHLSDGEEKEIRKIIDNVGGRKGDRYPPAMMAVLFGDSPEPQS